MQTIDLTNKVISIVDMERREAVAMIKLKDGYGLFIEDIQTVLEKSNEEQGDA